MPYGFDTKDIKRDACMLTGNLSKKGYDWWWHSLTAVSRRTGKEKSFFIEYFVCNPALGGDEPVFGQLHAGRRKSVQPSYLMVKAGCWGEDARQLHRFFGWNDVEINYDAPFYVAADDCYASEDRIMGRIFVSRYASEDHPEWMCDYGRMSWDLTVDKQIPFNVGYGAGKFLRKMEAFQMYWHAEGMKTKYEGEIYYDGETFDVIPDRCYGYADKNWGRDFTSPWVWLSSNCMRSNITGRILNNSVFDIGGGRPKIYFLPLNRILLGAFYYEGMPIEFNFSKFWTLPGTKFEAKETDDEIIWHIEQKNWKYQMITDVRCFKKDMLLINYEAPNGKKEHNRLWNGGTGIGRIQLFRKIRGGKELIDDIAMTHVGCEYGLMDWDK